MGIRRVVRADFDEWLRMRLALWPADDPAEHTREMEVMLTDANCAVFVHPRPHSGLCAFVEAGTRAYADGCNSSPVGYIEGWYVDADWRRRGVGAALLHAAEQWAQERGYTEMASDCLLENRASFQAHLASGYQEVERLIHFRKRL